MSVTLRKVTEGDLEQIMRWRMDPEITRYMNTDPKLTLEGQKKWFAKVQQDPDVSYWIIEIDGTAAGVINYTGLTNPTGDLGWAYYVGEKKLRSIQTALALEMSMYDHAFLDLGKNAVYSDVFTLNQGVIQLHKICGCEVVEELRATYSERKREDEKTGTAEKWMQGTQSGQHQPESIERCDACGIGDDLQLCGKPDSHQPWSTGN